MIKKLALVAIIAFAAPSVAVAQDGPPECEKEGYNKKDVTVQLDSTGVSGWRFLNPRAPFSVVEYVGDKTKGPDPFKWVSCARKGTVTFFNSASGEALVVAIPYTYRRFDLRRLADLIVEQKDSAAAAKEKIASDLGSSIEDEFDPNTEDKSFVTGIPLRARAIAKKFRSGEKMEHDEIEKSLYEEISLVTGAQRKVAKWLSNATAVTSGDDKNAAIRLNDALIRLGAFLQDGINAIESAQEQPPLSECPDAAAESQVCTFKFTIFDNGTFKIPTKTWERMILFSDGVVRFKVSFFDEQIPVSNAEGYLKVRPEVRERPSSTTWAVAASAGYNVKAQSDRKRPENGESRPFTLDDPYTGKTVDFFNGSARLDLTQTFMERARARVSPQFKDGALGGDDKTRTFSVPLYTIDVFGLNGVSGRFGKYSMLSPSRGIAINASGEGFQLNWRNVMVGHIVTSESGQGVPDETNQDSSVTLLRLSGAPGFSVFKHIDLFGLYGEKRKKQDTPYDYYTWGGQLFFASSADQPEPQSTFSSLSGSVSYFHSNRDVGTQGTTPRVDGSGSVWLLDTGITWLHEDGADTKALRSLSVLLGGGTGDNPNSPHRDESYLGETASFSGFDSMFLSSFPSMLQDASPARLPFGTGLANKFYLGASYVERDLKQINLLWWLSQMAQLAGDAKSPATTLKAHWFHLDEPFQDRRDAGFEAGLQWQIEVPAGIKHSLGCSRYFPGSATHRFFLVDPMQCSLQVSLTLQ